MCRVTFERLPTALTRAASVQTFLHSTNTILWANITHAAFYEILVLKVHNVVFSVTILSILLGGYQFTL